MNLRKKNLICISRFFSRGKSWREIIRISQKLWLPCHRWRCYWCRQHAVWVISGSHRQPWSISCNRLDVNFERLRNAMFAEFHSIVRVAWSSPTIFLTSAMYRSSDLFRRWLRKFLCCRQPWSISRHCLPFRGIPTISHVHFAVHLAWYYFTFGIIPTPAASLSV